MYVPDQKILDKYADVLINFALNSGKGIKKGDVVFLEVPECAKPMLISLQRAVMKAGGHYITNYLPDDTARHFYELAEEHHLDFFPEVFLKGKVDQADHRLSILADTNLKELEGIDPSKIMRRNRAYKKYREWLDKKENEGKHTWTLALYGTGAMAHEAGISLEEYWDQIIKACFLDYDNPVEQWRKVFVEIEELRQKLNALEIEKLKIKSKNVDLTVGIGKGRTWMGGSGRNIPSFELFISPDWRKTEGKIKFDLPLYRYGNIIRNIFLRFENGKVVESGADSGANVIKEMIAVENADKIGEFSLTDIRFSRINKFMAETLFDENFGGEYGNTHIALGNAYKDSYPGDPSKVSDSEWRELGYNESAIHTDMISTENREVTAILSNGEEKLIYKDGKFTL